MSNPFMSIVTRCCQRPRRLSENIASVKSQKCQDVEQIFIVDRNRDGVSMANRSLAKNKHRVDGRYVYILDDDCMLIDDGFVGAIKRVVTKHEPDIVMVKSRRPPGPPSRSSLVPTKRVWGKRPRFGSTNTLCYVTRNNLWKKHIHMYGAKHRGGDWWFLKDMLKTKPDVFWLDRTVADARQLGRGKIFEEVSGDWFSKVAKKHELNNLGKDDWRLRLWMRS